MSKYQIRYTNADDVGIGELLGDIAANGYEYYDATLTDKINCAGTLTFTLLPTNPALPNLALRKTTIMLYRETKEVWRGRIIRTDIDMFNRRVITCEGALAWFYDVVVKGFPPHFGPIGVDETTPSARIADIFTYYRNQCSSNRKMGIGTVEPTINWYLQEDDDYHTIFDLLSQLLANSGGFFKVGYTNGELVLNYLNYPTAASGQYITFGHNLFDLARTIDASNVVTSLIAEDSAGHTTTITNATMETAFGKSQAYRYFNDCDSSSVLFTLAMEWFNNNCLANTTISVSALDLNLTDEAYEAFYVGQPVHIVSEPHGVDTMMILTEMQTDISNPQASQLTLGTAPKSLTHYVKSGGGSGDGTGAVSGGRETSAHAISPTISQTAGNSTLTVTEARKYGDVVQIGFYISVTGNVAEGENIWSGTLSDYLPVAYISTAAYYGVATPSAGVFRITAAGDMNFRLVKGALSNGASLYCGLTYITEG